MGYNQKENEFGLWLPTDDEVRRAAAIAVNQVLDIKRDETVLIVSNPQEDVARLSFALYDAAHSGGAAVTLAFQSIKSQMDFTEEAIISAVESEPDVLISMSAEKLGQDIHRLHSPYEVDGKKYTSAFHYQLWAKRSLRAFWSPSITLEQFVKTVPVDYGLLRRQCVRLKAVLDKAVEMKISSPGGTRISVGIENRISYADDGDFTTPGTGGNLPAGEVFVSPAVGTSDGIIVFDGSISVEQGTILIEEPIEVHVNKGFISDVTGASEAAMLKETIERAEKNSYRYEEEGKLEKGSSGVYARNARNIGEVGIGLNPKAGIIGNMLIDEKAYRTCHFAIGYNYDRDAPALIHLDGLVKEPTIIAVGPDSVEHIVLENGKPVY
jgi:leucyl aminopeptidase (aminopeptidase T)